MKYVFSFFLLNIVFFFHACSVKQAEKEKLMVVDVTKKYSEREIHLEDIAHISYIHLGTDDEDYLYKGFVFSITQNSIVVYDRSTESLLFFSKDGSPKSRFNNRGNGPGEYTNIFVAMYDEKNDELYVPLFFGNRIEVYSSVGIHKRTIPIPEKTNVAKMFLLDDGSLLIHDRSKAINMTSQQYDITTKGKINELTEADEGFSYPFVRISKTDGTILSYINLPEDDKPELVAFYKKNDRVTAMSAPTTNRILKYKEGFLLHNTKTDTIFYCDNKLQLTPLMVQTPSITSLNPEVILSPFVEGGFYYFFDVFTFVVENTTPPRISSTNLAWDKRSDELVRPKIVFDEYKGKEIQINPQLFFRVDEAQTGLVELGLEELKEAYKSNKLQGKLKELVASLDEEKDNNVYMLLHFK